MKFRNSGKGTSNILQNQFTRYLRTAIQRKRIDVLKKRKKTYSYEQHKYSWKEYSVLVTEDIYFKYATQFESIDLEQSLLQIGRRDQYILYAHVLDERSFAELALELGMSYKGVATAYYRVIRKIREKMRGDENGF